MLSGDMDLEIDERGVRYLPYAVVGIVMVYMTWIRTMAYSSVVTEDRVLFSANDPWYHIRTVEFLVENYPTTFPFDPWTYYPYGSPASGGFGGLYDQIIATVAIIVGLGNPSPRQVDIITALAPVAFGVLTAIPVYLIARRLTDKWFGLIAPVVLALATGQFLNRTTVGNVQHQAAEVFFLPLSVLGFIVAVQAAYDEKPTFAHFKDRDWRGLRKPMRASVLGGLALAGYATTWPPAIFVLAPFGAMVIIQMVRDHLNGEPTEYLAISTMVFFVAAAVPTFIYTLLIGVRVLFRLTGTAPSILQPAGMFAAAAGVLVLHLVGVYLRSEEYDRTVYPVAVGGIIVVGLGVMWLTGFISLFEALVTRMFSFGYLTSEGALTVAEIQPAGLLNIIQGHGTIIVLSVIGIAGLIDRVVREDSPVELVVLLWSINMFSAYLTQLRFGYYFTLAVAVLAAYGVYRVVELANFKETFVESGSWEDVKGYQVITVLMLVFLFLPVVIVPVGGGGPAWTVADRGVGGGGPWQSQALPWMEENTPEVPLEFNKRYSVPDDGDYDYPEGVYGVMSWWDYGHWITYIGKRVPNANPFQQGNIISSLFFTAQSEERANLLLDALPAAESGSELEGMSNQELREMIQGQTEQERIERDTRYVMIDDQMAAGKFGAIATWTDFNEYGESQRFTIGQGNRTRNVTLTARGEGYKDTMLSKLYFNDADGMEHYRLVHETETYSLIGSIADVRSRRLVQFNRVLGRVDHNSTSLLGIPMAQAGRLPDDQTISLSRGGSRYLYDFESAASVKTFERVEGATLKGEANVSNTTEVVALVEMRTENTGRNFTYTQRVQTDEDGSFNMTVPYPTVDDLSVEQGGTDAAVSATGPYEVYAGRVSIINILGQQRIVGERESAEVDVRESQVLNGEEVRVDLQEVQRGNQTAGGLSLGGGGGTSPSGSG